MFAVAAAKNDSGSSINGDTAKESKHTPAATPGNNAQRRQEPRRDPNARRRRATEPQRSPSPAYAWRQHRQRGPPAGWASRGASSWWEYCSSPPWFCTRSSSPVVPGHSKPPSITHTAADAETTPRQALKPRQAPRAHGSTPGARSKVPHLLGRKREPPRPGCGRRHHGRGLVLGSSRHLLRPRGQRRPRRQGGKPMGEGALKKDPGGGGALQAEPRRAHSGAWRVAHRSPSEFEALSSPHWTLAVALGPSLPPASREKVLWDAWDPVSVWCVLARSTSTPRPRDAWAWAWAWASRRGSDHAERWRVRASALGRSWLVLACSVRFSAPACSASCRGVLLRDPCVAVFLCSSECFAWHSLREAQPRGLLPGIRTTRGARERERVCRRERERARARARKRGTPEAYRGRRREKLPTS